MIRRRASRRFFGCLAGSFSLSCRQMRSPRLSLTTQPTWLCAGARRSCDSRSGHSGGPGRQCPQSAAARRPGRRSAALRGAVLPQHAAYPALRYALWQETGRTWSMQARRREGLRCFPAPPPSGSACPASVRQPPCEAARSLSQALSADEAGPAHAAMLLAPPVEHEFRNADLPHGIRHRHALAPQDFSLPKLRDDLFGLVSLVCYRGPPSWPKPYSKVDPFNGGRSVSDTYLGGRLDGAAPIKCCVLRRHLADVVPEARSATDEIRHVRRTPNVAHFVAQHSAPTQAKRPIESYKVFIIQ